MGGGKQRKETENIQRSIRDQQLSQGEKQFEASQARLVSSDRLRQPAINYYSSLASGDPSRMLTAAAVPLGNISRAAAGARESAMNTMPRGAARDFAISGIDRDAYGQSASFLNQAFLSSFPALAGMATEDSQLGLQHLGAGYRGVEGAGNTNNQIQQIQQQQKASQLGLFGNIAGMAAGAATGGLMGGGGAARPTPASATSMAVGPNPSSSSLLSWLNPSTGGMGRISR